MLRYADTRSALIKTPPIQQAGCFKWLQRQGSLNYFLFISLFSQLLIMEEDKKETQTISGLLVLSH